MLPKINRIDKKTMDGLFKSGSFVNTPNLTLRFSLASKPQSPTKIAFITPKSLGLNSPQRNALRRRGYNVVRPYIARLPKGFIGAFIFKKKNTKQELEKEVLELVEKYEKTVN